MKNNKDKTLIILIFLIWFVAVIILIVPKKVRWENNNNNKKTTIKIIKEVSNKYGINPIYLISIALQESSFGKELIGDNKCSHGIWQINLCVFPEMKEKIGDVEAEAEWVANKLIEYKIKNNFVSLAFAKYNAPARPNWKYSERVKNRFSEAEKLLQ